MMVQMLGVFAEFERAMIIDRVIAGMERKAARGEWTAGSAPYGYEVDPESSYLATNPTEAPLIPGHLRSIRPRPDGRQGGGRVAQRPGVPPDARTLTRGACRRASARVARGMLGQRSIGEVDDVDVEVDGVPVGTLGEELERRTGGRLRVILTSSNATRASLSSSITPRSNLVEWDNPMAEQHNLVR